MSSLSISLKNEPRIKRAFAKAPREFMAVLQKAMEQTGGETLGKVKQVITSGTGMWKAPVDTGAMRGNISITEKVPLRVVIEPNQSITPYAKYVHDGTSNMSARPFLEITKQTEEKNIRSFFERTLNNFVNELSRNIG